MSIRKRILTNWQLDSGFRFEWIFTVRNNLKVTDNSTANEIIVIPLTRSSLKWCTLIKIYIYRERDDLSLSYHTIVIMCLAYTTCSDLYLCWISSIFSLRINPSASAVTYNKTMLLTTWHIYNIIDIHTYQFRLCR